MAVRMRIGSLRQVGTVSNPGTPVPDGLGGYTLTYTPLNPAQWRFAIQRATVRSTERHFGGIVVDQASYMLTGRFHPEIATQTQVTWVDRAGVTHTANVLAVDDTEGAGVETVVLVSELVT